MSRSQRHERGQSPRRIIEFESGQFALRRTEEIIARVALRFGVADPAGMAGMLVAILKREAESRGFHLLFLTVNRLEGRKNRVEVEIAFKESLEGRRELKLYVEDAGLAYRNLGGIAVQWQAVFDAPEALNDFFLLLARLGAAEFENARGEQLERERV